MLICGILGIISGLLLCMSQQIDRGIFMIATSMIYNQLVLIEMKLIEKEKG